ncbi:MAG: hypothetical protein HY902_13610, partial [Deltaproteobacteria bacterium]|nr:hypothetical protein [Deltaproteobacteria bacterium]
MHSPALQVPWSAILTSLLLVACGQDPGSQANGDVAALVDAASNGDASDTAAVDAVGPGSDGADTASDGPAVDGQPNDTTDDTGPEVGDHDAKASDTQVVVGCTVDGDCPPPGPCQVAACGPAGQCIALAASEGALCDDGNACTTKDLCAAGACGGAGTLACDDQNPCTVDSCNPISGCINLPAAASTACDDGDACTANDTCLAGKCQPGAMICQCQNNADCGKYEDGNQCNGALYCDKSAGAPYTCKLNPASVVVCVTSQDSPCQKNTCVPATGECKLVVAPGNTPCDDGDSCTVGDFCEQGLCQGGSNTCYCKKDADCAPFEDGNLCNGALFCNKATSQCQVNPVSVVSCQTVDDTYCQQNLCNPKDGKCYPMPVHQGKACDDGNACTPNETCQSGVCSTATNTCECQSDADCAKKDDGNLCNGTLYCDVASNHCKVNPASVVVCDTADDPACLQTTCDPKTGQCAPSNLPKDGTACDDGNPCTPSSFCTGGSCLAQANLCECQKDSDCSAKEDGDLCNGTLYCDKSGSGKPACKLN